MSLRPKSLRKRELVAIVGVTITLLAAFAMYLVLSGGGTDDDSPSGVAESYMRAQLSSDENVCDYMTDAMQEGWISNVNASFSPPEVPETCDEATKVFIDWSKQNGQVFLDADEIKITTSGEKVDGDEAKVTVRSELSETNKSQTVVVLQRVDGRWLVAGTEEP